MHRIITRITNASLSLFLVLSLTACGKSTSAGTPALERTPRPVAAATSTPEPKKTPQPTEETVTATEEPVVEEPVTETPEPTKEPVVTEESPEPEQTPEPSALPAIDPTAILNKLGADPSEIVESLSGGLSGLVSLISSGSYEDIYNEYSKKLTDLSPDLIEEYKSEAASNTNGIEGLAEIANSKVEQLAEIDAEGTEAMAQFMYTKGAGNYEEYEKWATKLYEVYNTEATKIYNMYLSSSY